MCGKYVEHKGKEIPMKLFPDGRLYLSMRGHGVKDIRDIKNLDQLTELTELDLSQNQIKEICCLDNLINLRSLNLGGNEIEIITGLNNLVNLQSLKLNGNNITSISGMGNLKKLVFLYLNDNPIYIWAKENLGGTDPNLIHANRFLRPQMIVEYCQILPDYEPSSIKPNLNAALPKNRPIYFKEARENHYMDLEVLATFLNLPPNKVISFFYGLTIKGVVEGTVDGKIFKPKYGMTNEVNTAVINALNDGFESVNIV